MSNYSVKTDARTLYTEVYMKERTRVVSRFYNKFGNSKIPAGYDETLTFEQFKKELGYIRALHPTDYGKKFIQHIRNLVKADVKYSMKQNMSVLKHLNMYITEAWKQASGRRSPQGRYKEDWALKPENGKGSGYQMLITFIIANKGLQAKLNDCLLQLNDVVGQSYYFTNIYDIVNIEILGGDASELYAS